MQSISNQFEDGFTVSYHMAPPLLPWGKDGRGRPLKREFGAWMSKPMRVMAGMKFLRGTPADIFSYTSERRMERRLIPWYSDLMKQCEVSLSPDTAESWLNILRAPMDIRGYGSVKQQAVDQVQSRVEVVLAGMAKG